MLLAYALRSTRARWFGVSSLVLAVTLSAPSPAGAQDGTVYIGGGSNSQDGVRGVQGRDNVIVNMDAVDGGRGRASTGNAGPRSAPGNQPAVEFGEPYRGPAGAILRFPPERPPESQLVVDPDELPDQQRQARRDVRPSDPLPARKPARPAQPQQQQRTAETAPATQPDAPSNDRATAQSEPTRSVEVPDRPSLEAGDAPDSGSRTAQQIEQDSVQPSSDDLAPTRLTARPARKPQPPQDAGSTAQPAAERTETAARSKPAGDAETAEPAATSKPAAPPEPESTRTAVASEPADEDTAASASQNGTAASDSTTGDSADDTAETATASAPSDGTETADSAGSRDTDETQMASLPPSGLPEQMRLMFNDGSAALSNDAKQQLDQLAQVLEDNPRQRVQLMAFAQGTEDTASQARRLSLSRALAVRTYLIDQGIRSTRMDVRALGATADQGPLDRVDVVPANR